MKTRILKAILKGINEGLANFDLDDYEDDVAASAKKIIYQDDVLRILKYKCQMLNLMSKENIGKEDIQQCIDLHNEFGVLYNPHLDGEDFRIFIHNIVDILGDEADLNWIDTADVTNMNGLFYNMSNFNGDISEWNVSNVTNMERMFEFAVSFNKPIGNWDTSNVEEMVNMFSHASSFNKPIGNWNTSKVTNMRWMFWNAISFNQPIGNWDTSNVTDMASMFYDAKSFNQDISNWNTTNVTNTGVMYRNCPISKENKPKFN